MNHFGVPAVGGLPAVDLGEALKIPLLREQALKRLQAPVIHGLSTVQFIFNKEHHHDCGWFLQEGFYKKNYGENWSSRWEEAKEIARVMKAEHIRRQVEAENYIQPQEVDWDDKSDTEALCEEPLTRGPLIVDRCMRLDRINLECTNVQLLQAAYLHSKLWWGSTMDSKMWFKITHEALSGTKAVRKPARKAKKVTVCENPEIKTYNLPC